MIETDYFSAIAQLLPLLYLAIAFEYRWLKLEPEEESEPIDGAVILFIQTGFTLTFVFGETAALAALERGDTSALIDSLTVGALVVGAIFLLLLPAINSDVLPDAITSALTGIVALATVAAPVTALIVLAT